MDKIIPENKLAELARVSNIGLKYGSESPFILSERIKDIFFMFGLQMLNGNFGSELIPNPTGLDVDKIVYKTLRFRHQPVGKGKRVHTVCYGAHKLNGEIGLTRDDERKLEPLIVKLNDRFWHQIPCPVPGCHGAIRITTDGEIVIWGTLERHENNDWTYCKEIPGCAII